MPHIRRIIIGLSLLQAFWMTFDGTRALIIGDYLTPKSGRMPTGSGHGRGWSLHWALNLDRH
ncbi:MAG: hypothetical protein IPG76_05160 [Acidobacteria bacterium]|nr:hypothetical protein [Acidobacteriota bacterium]